MNRRALITLLGGTVAWPLAVRAQQQATSTIGFVSSRAPGESAGVVAAFRQGIGGAGFVEGQNLAIAFRWAEGRYDRLPALVAELVNLRVAVLFAAGGPPSALAVKEATSTIPVVFSAVSDPVRLGLVPSLNRPGGNVTGMSLLNSELVAKSAQLLKEAVPAAAVIAFLVNPSGPSAEIFAKEAPATARALGTQIPVLNASTEHDLDEVFASLGGDVMRRAIVYAAAVGALLIWPPLVLIFFCCCRPSVQQLMESDPEGMRRRSPGRRGSPAAWRRLIASRAPVPQANDAENYDCGQHRSAKEYDEHVLTQPLRPHLTGSRFGGAATSKKAPTKQS